jgi:hypothetical protein
MSRYYTFFLSVYKKNKIKGLKLYKIREYHDPEKKKNFF